jgi:peptidoglycan/LPS O-acetylase OafA/YrhL
MKRPTYLEGLRGLAAWMVVLGHSVNVFWPAWTGAGGSFDAVTGWARTLVQTPLSLPFRARFAVLIFFVHSGFVLSYRYFTAGRRPEDLASAAVRRYVRLALPAMASVFIGYLVLRAGWLHVQPVAAVTGSGWMGGHYLAEPSFLGALKQGLWDYFFGNGVGPAQSYNSPLWTITTEFKASFVVFALVGLFGGLRHRWFIYGVCGFVLSDTMYLPFVLGVALCDLYTHPRAQARLAAVPLWARLLCVAFAVWIGSWSTQGATHWLYAWAPWVGPQSDLFQSLGAAALVFAITTTPAAQRFFDSRPLRFLGEISYSVYLLHMIALFSLCSMIYLPLRASGLSPDAAALIPLGVTFVVTFVGAVIIRRYVDLPSITLGKRIHERFFAPRAAAE